MKKFLISGVIVLTLALAYGAYWAYHEYTVLSSEEVQNIQMYLVQSQLKAYKIGVEVCNKST